MTNPELVALIKKHPISFGCGALSLVLAIALYLRVDEIPGAEAELGLKSADGDRIALNIQYSTQMREHADAMSAAVNGVEDRLVRPTQLGSNTQYFYKLESETGVKIIDLRQTAATVAAAKGAKNTYVAVPFSVSVQGTLPQILEFLRQLENGAHYCRVLTASFGGAAANRNSALTLGLSLELLGKS
ncbi:MAG: hypothetical protein ABIQ12_11715 [Opitutaceae bacterium]